MGSIHRRWFPLVDNCWYCPFQVCNLFRIASTVQVRKRECSLFANSLLVVPITQIFVASSVSSITSSSDQFFVDFPSLMAALASGGISCWMLFLLGRSSTSVILVGPIDIWSPWSGTLSLGGLCCWCSLNVTVHVHFRSWSFSSEPPGCGEER